MTVWSVLLQGNGCGRGSFPYRADSSQRLQYAAQVSRRRGTDPSPTGAASIADPKHQIKFTEDEMDRNPVPADLDALNSNRCDVLVVGGGPGGSTVATMLARKGWSVTVLEKDQFPRFHIGESLLPKNLPILEKLGVLDEVEAMGIRKPGADFNHPDRAIKQHKFYFARALEKKPEYAYEVRRSEFDHLLLKNSTRNGALVHHGIRVTDVEFRPGQTTLVKARDEQGSTQLWEARYFIDASGRDTLLHKKFGSKVKNTKHQSAAIFGHFENVERRQGYDEGNISVYWFDHGWFWMIPLRDGTMSVGAVCRPEYLKTRDCSTEEFLWKTIHLSQGVTQRMREAKLISEVRATGNYSYGGTHMCGEGYLMVGDAYAFVDPIFSSGVLMAMTNGMNAADIVDAHLAGKKSEAKRLTRRYEADVKRGIRTFSWFIWRFNNPGMQRLFLEPGNPFRIEEAVTSVLAGDVYRRHPSIRLRLLAFKVLYYIFGLIEWRQTLEAHRTRQRNNQVQFTGGTTQQDAQ